jgi:hypothetical protein
LWSGKGINAGRSWKYLVEGATLAGDEAMVVAKIGPTGKLVIVTVYAQ